MSYTDLILQHYGNSFADKAIFGLHVVMSYLLWRAHVLVILTNKNIIILSVYLTFNPGSRLAELLERHNKDFSSGVSCIKFVLQWLTDLVISLVSAARRT